MPVNNVTRFLDSRKIQYTAIELPPEKMGAEEVARLIDAPPDIVFKSIVITRRERGKPILAVVPGDKDVNLKLLAKAVGEKKVSPATQKEAESLPESVIKNAHADYNKAYKITEASIPTYISEVSEKYNLDTFVISHSILELITRIMTLHGVNKYIILQAVEHAIDSQREHKKTEEELSKMN